MCIKGRAAANQGCSALVAWTKDFNVLDQQVADFDADVAYRFVSRGVPFHRKQSAGSVAEKEHGVDSLAVIFGPPAKTRRHLRRRPNMSGTRTTGRSQLRP